jgi:hypothetical protein
MGYYQSQLALGSLTTQHRGANCYEPPPGVVWDGAEGLLLM